MPTKRMGPAARSFAADAHDCIMVRIQTDLPHTSVRREDAPMASSPRMIMTQTPELRNEKPIARFIVPPRAQAFKALRNTSDAKAARRQAPLAFRSLDPFRALREPDRRRRDEERPSRSEQRTGNKPKTPLDRKSPIQVRIHSPPAASQQTFSASAQLFPQTVRIVRFRNPGLPRRGFALSAAARCGVIAPAAAARTILPPRVSGT